MNLVVIDCYDSFTYNLVHYLEQMSSSIDCIRNDRVNVDRLDKYDGIILSPGPGLPAETKNLHDIIKKWGKTKPILGICLGHQAIGTFFGLDLENMPAVHHGIGRQTIIIKNDEQLFDGLPQSFLSARYHSWVIRHSKESSHLQVTAVDMDGTIMGLSHQEYNIKGVQFHPESILTEHGFRILKNWVDSISDYRLSR
jgi:anthranilate synthase component II